MKGYNLYDTHIPKTASLRENKIKISAMAREIKYIPENATIKIIFFVRYGTNSTSLHFRL